jgi:integrase
MRRNVKDVSTRYQAERMPTRLCTARVYRSFLDNHVLPKWGDTLIRDVQPRPVELWLRQLPLAPKSKTHVRSLLHSLVDFAMWAGILEVARNPISLVVNKGATKRVRKARSLTVAQFRALLSELREPFSTLALLCVCLGLRMSEALALRWSDVDWLGSRLSIKRGIVERVVDEVKTEASAKTFVLAGDLFARLKAWKQLTRFSGTEDWIFASPVKIGRLPYSYTGVWRDLQRAADASGIGRLGTHSFRHTYRSWLDAVGTPIAVQQKMMRHTDIRTTMNIYGDVVTDEMATAGGKIARLVFPVNGAQAERSEA